MLFFDCLTEPCKKYLKNCFCLPCKRTKSYIQFERGIDAYLREVDIVNFIQEIRYLKSVAEVVTKQNQELGLKISRHRRNTIGSETTPITIQLTSDIDDEESLSSFNDN